MINAAARTVPRASSALRTNLVLLAVSVGLALLVLEVAARVLLPAPLPWRYPQARYRPEPALIFGLEPDQRGFTADKAVTINERGLRGAVVPYERTPGRLRLLFLGDSITFGYGVADDEVVSARVTALLDQQGVPAESINAAVPSYNTEQEVAYLEREGVRYAPDWVIVGVCWNDINDKSEVQVDAHGWLTTDAGTPETAFTRASESPFGYAVRNGLKRSRLLYGVLEGWRTLLGTLFPDGHMLFLTDVLEGRETPRITQGWQQLEAAVKRLKELASARGFRPLLVPFPVPLALDRPLPHSSYPARLRGIAEREGIAFIDLEPPFRAAYRGHESLFIPYDGDHPNGAGHALAAREIVGFLTAARGKAS
jgi:lysophospholipase L1-like esterase